MYIKQDHIKILKDNPNLFFAQTKFGKRFDFETIEEKLLLANVWANNMSSNELYLPAVKEMLGKSWLAYLNPLTQKISGLLLDEILMGEWNKFNEVFPEEARDLVEAILHDKLYKYIEYQGVTGLSESLETGKNDLNNKYVIYQLASKYDRDRSIIKVKLIWENNLFNIEITFLDFGTPTDLELKNSSVKEIKGLMFEMSEEDELDVSRIKDVIEKISFKDLIADSFIKNIIGYRKK